MKRMLAVLFFSLASAAAEIEVKNSEFFTDPRSGLTVVRGEVSLPVREIWYLPGLAPDTEPPQTLVAPPADAADYMQGRRFRQAELMRKTREGRQNLQTLYWRLWAYARAHEGKLPETLEAAAPGDTWWTEQAGKMKDALFMVPLPDLRLTEDNPQGHREVILAFETAPAVDDGLHWVLLGDGGTVRRPIDRELAAKWKVEIRPAPRPADEKTTVRAVHTIYGIRKKEGQPPAALKLVNMRGGALAVSWDMAAAKPGPRDILDKWNEQRTGMWKYLDAQAGGYSVAQAWLRMAGEEHEAANRNPWDGGEVESTDVFGILGGQAALKETLQLRPIAGGGGPEEAGKLRPVAEIPGVQVKSHPFAEMLKGGPGGQLDLANWCPEDRLVAYIPRPEAVLPMLDQGNDFLFRMALPLSGNNISYGIKRRMFARMGVSEEWIRAALATGAVKEFAILLPDLFLIDGTDATLVVRLSNPALFAPLWKAAGADPASGDIMRVAVAGGGAAYWSARGEMLVIGTHRGEVERVLELGRKNGEGSLGRSAEFRYMLTQMPVQDSTRMLVYISDSFIRRLVGPEAKIGQLRRLLARRDLERITAGALLARADGMDDASDLEALVKKGYVPADLRGGDYALGPDGVAVSARYGTLDRPRTLLEVPVGGVTEWEANAYKRYLENYSRFWRQFFDPIAIRLDDEPDGGLGLTTFILPLLDSTIFNDIREVVATREDEKPLPLPVVTPPPVLRLSANLKEAAWQEFANEAAESLTRALSLQPGLFDELGPSVHFAVLDGDPVLALGSSDLLGAFGRDLDRISDSEMVLIPVIASILTRPCVLMVELRDPDEVVRVLDSACTAPAAAQDRGELTVSYYKLEGKNRWTCMVDLFGFARMRFGIEVREGMLLVDNLPWSPWPEKLARSPAPLNGVDLQVNCGAAREQLSALYTSSMERYRTAAMQGLARLLPLRAAGASDPAAAAVLHDRLYGFTPVHPGKGKWLVSDNGEWRSDSYGGFGRQTQPGHEKGSRDFGVFQSIESFSVNMQFEDTGLRVKMSWK